MRITRIDVLLMILIMVAVLAIINTLIDVKQNPTPRHIVKLRILSVF
jgi:hypothetical protein